MCSSDLDRHAVSIAMVAACKNRKAAAAVAPTSRLPVRFGAFDRLSQPGGSLLANRWVMLVVLGLVALTSACRKPDLVVASGPPKVDLAKTGVPGGSLRLQPWTIRNQGTSSTAASGGWFANGYYLSTDPVITSEDRQLKGLTDTDAADLEPGQSYTVAGDNEIVIPEDVKPGTYYFGVLIDRSNRVDEVDETNNALSVRIGIVKEP